MFELLIIETPAGKDTIICNDTEDCAQQIYGLDYFQYEVEDLFVRGNDFSFVREVIFDTIIIEGKTWIIAPIQTKIHFTSAEDARQVFSDLVRIAEKDYSGTEDQRDQ